MDTATQSKGRKARAAGTTEDKWIAATDEYLGGQSGIDAIITDKTRWDPGRLPGPFKRILAFELVTPGLPLCTRKYPFKPTGLPERYESDCIRTGIHEYMWTALDRAVVRYLFDVSIDSAGVVSFSPELNKSDLKAYLLHKCNVQLSELPSWADISRLLLASIEIEDGQPVSQPTGNKAEPGKAKEAVCDEARVLAVFVDNPDLNKTQIAELAHVNRQRLYDMPKFMAAWEKHQEAQAKSRADAKNYKKTDPETGEVSIYEPPQVDAEE